MGSFTASLRCSCHVLRLQRRTRYPPWGLLVPICKTVRLATRTGDCDERKRKGRDECIFHHHSRWEPLRRWCSLCGTTVLGSCFPTLASPWLPTCLLSLKNLRDAFQSYEAILPKPIRIGGDFGKRRCWWSFLDRIPTFLPRGTRVLQQCPHGTTQPCISEDAALCLRTPRSSTSS